MFPDSYQNESCDTAISPVMLACWFLLPSRYILDCASTHLTLIIGDVDFRALEIGATSLHATASRVVGIIFTRADGLVVTFS